MSSSPEHDDGGTSGAAPAPRRGPLKKGAAASRPVSPAPTPAASAQASPAEGPSSLAEPPSAAASGSPPSAPPPGLRWRLPRLVYYALLVLGLLLMALTATLAQRQSPHPDLLRSTGAWDVGSADWWLYPREVNGFKRRVVTGNLRGAFALPGSRLLWAVGQGGLILHSPDGGGQWQQQYPPLPPSAAPGPAQALAAWLPQLLPAAHAMDAPKSDKGSNVLPAPGKAGNVPPELAKQQPRINPSRGPLQVQSNSGSKAAGQEQRPPDVPAAGPKTTPTPITPPVVVDDRPQALDAIHFADAQRGWAVGSRRDGRALLLATSDGGQNWRRVALQPSAQALRSVAFTADGQRGWAAGDGGTLLSTNDGGGTWALSRPVQGAAWQAVRTTAGGEALWLVGLQAQENGSNAGLIWLRAAQPGEDGTGAIVHREPGVALFAAALHPVSQQLWAAGTQGTVLSPEPSTQGAATRWRATALPTTPSFGPITLSALAFDGAGQNLWLTAAEGGAWRRALQGGAYQALPTGTAAGLAGLAVLGEQAWAVGDAGTLLASQSSATGPRWQAQTMGLRGRLTGVVFRPDGRSGWAAGGDGLVLATADAGASWRVQRRGGGDTFSALTLQADGQRLWAASGGTLWRSDDAGKAWASSAVQPPGLLVPPVVSLSVDASGRQAWAGALAGGLRRSGDGGASWQASPGTSGATMAQVATSADGRRVWAASTSGAVLRSLDGGATWQISPAPTDSGYANANASPNLLAPQQAPAWQAVAPLADGRLWLASATGEIAQLAADGRGPTLQRAGDGVGLNVLRSLGDGQRAWAAGEDGRILATQDGGTQWEAQRSGTALTLHGLALTPDGQRLWAVGEGATLQHSADGGRSWAESGAYQRGWAPWAFVALALLATGLAVLLVAVAPAEQGQAIEAMAPMAAAGASTTLASDQPVFDKAQDVLGYREAVEALSSFLRNEATEPRVTVAVSGEWGSGKSSIMRMLQTELRRAGFRTAWYNAWHQQQEGRPLTALFNAIRQQAVPRWFEQPLGALRVRSRLIWGRGGLYRAVSLLAALGLAVLAGDLLGSDEHNAWQRIQANARHYLLGQHTLVLDSASLASLNPFAPAKDAKPDLSLWASACATPASLDNAARLPSPPLSPSAFCAVATQALPTADWATTSPSLGCRLRPSPGSSSAQACRFASAEVLQATLVDSLRLSATDAQRVVKAAQTVPPPDLFRWLQGSLVSGLAGVVVLLFTKGVSVYGLQLLGPLKGVVGAKLVEESGGKESAGTVERYREEFSLLCDALDGRLVVFIDDLDRCNPDTVNRTLELTNYLVDVGRCFVVIGAAMERVKKCVRPPVFMAKSDSPEGQKEAMDYANDYLRKLVHVELPVPARGSSLQRLLEPAPSAHAQTQARSGARRVLAERLGLGLAVGAAVGALWMAFDLGTRLHGTGASTALALDAPAGVPSAGTDPTLAAPGVPVAPAAAALLAAQAASGNSGPVGLQAPGAAGNASASDPGGLPRSAWGALGACALVLAGALAWRRLRRYRETLSVALGGALREKDSVQFLDALRLWSPLVIAHDPTPRQVKRFYNRTRLLAAFEADVPGGIDEAQLVALAAMDHATSGGTDRSGAAAGGFATDDLVAAAAAGEAELALVWDGQPIEAGADPAAAPTALDALLQAHHRLTGRWPNAAEVQRFAQRVDGLAVR